MNTARNLAQILEAPHVLNNVVMIQRTQRPSPGLCRLFFSCNACMPGRRHARTCKCKNKKFCRSIFFVSFIVTQHTQSEDSSTSIRFEKPLLSLPFAGKKKTIKIFESILAFQGILGSAYKAFVYPPVKALQALTSAFLRTLLLACPCV